MRNLPERAAAQITDQIFGVGFESYDIPIGILGLSPPVSDAQAQYDFVLDSMAIQGFINSRAFSLDLREVDSPDGEYMSWASEVIVKSLTTT
jgi:hypothetical protein